MELPDDLQQDPSKLQEKDISEEVGDGQDAEQHATAPGLSTQLQSILQGQEQLKQMVAQLLRRIPDTSSTTKWRQSTDASSVAPEPAYDEMRSERTMRGAKLMTSVQTLRASSFTRWDPRPRAYQPNSNPLIFREGKSRLLKATKALHKSMSNILVYGPHRSSDHSLANRIRMLPLLPDAILQFAFDVCGLVMITCDLFLIPYILAFHVADSAVPEPLRLFWLVGFLFWSLDMLRCFLTGYYIELQVLCSPCQAAWQYLSTWFAFDLLPLAGDVITLAAWYNEPDQAKLYLFTIERLARCLKVLNALRVLKYVISPQRQGRLSVITSAIWSRQAGSEIWKKIVSNSAVLLCLIFWAVHTGSCIYQVLLGFGKDIPGPSFTRTLLSSGQIQPDELGGLYVYFRGIYWTAALLFGGSSFEVPNNWPEAVAASLLSSTGFVFNIVVFSFFSAALVELNDLLADNTRKMNMLRCYLQQHGIKSALSSRVQNIVRRRINAEERFAEKDIEVLALLPLETRRELRQIVASPFMMSQPLLRACDAVDDTC